MKIIIVGCGKVGRSITEELSAEGHDVVVIDSRYDIVEDVSNTYDVMGMVGNGASFSVQLEAGIESADVLIAVTNSDELNLLCCLIAKKGGDCKTIARVRNPMYNSDIGFIKEELGVSMIINPELAAATEIARILRFPSAIEIDTFAKGRVELLEFKIAPSSFLAGCSVREVSKKVKAEVLICAVERGEEVIIPNGNFVLAEGDNLSIVASPLHARNFFAGIGIETHQVKNTTIVGGGTIAYYLAMQLLKMGIEVKIVEKNLKRCEELSELLPEAVIIHADATNYQVLIEEGIEGCESFVPLTGIDEGNVFLSLYAKKHSKAKTITKINRVCFDDVISTFNLGSIISPKKTTSEYILRYVRAMKNSLGSKVETLYKIVDDKAEALEFAIRENNQLIDKPLEELKLKDNLLIACINRKGEILAPNGKTRILLGDTVIVVTTQKGLHDITDILRA